MDLELKHLGQTLAVGGFAVFMALYLVRSFFPSFAARLFAKSDKLSVQHVALLFALALAAGILLEDFSKHYAARRSGLKNDVLEMILDSDKELRLRSLFDVPEAGPDRLEVKPRAIAMELAKVKGRNQSVENYLESIHKITRSWEANKKQAGDNPPPPVVIQGRNAVEAFEGAANGVYYEAKNRVYREATYFTELSEISNRMDFTRSGISLPDRRDRLCRLRDHRHFSCHL